MSEYPTYLIHYGIQGQKWGVRRFQNEDGTYTSDGLERRRQLQENGGSKREIRKAGREGRRELRYNKAMRKAQNVSNQKFDKLTERIKSERKAGLNTSEKDIKKAITLGTNVRQWDNIAKDPQRFYKTMRTSEVGGFTSGVLGGLSGIPVALAISAISTHKMNKYYQDLYEQARKETIEDLKKHKLI